MDDEKVNRNEELNTELAKNRTHISFERTLMAWIRTALSLIGFGIGIFEVAEKTGGEGVFRSSKLVGLLFVLLGVASVLFAIKENKVGHEQLTNPDFKYEKKSSLGVKVAYALVLIGLISFIHIILKLLNKG